MQLISLRLLSLVSLSAAVVLCALGSTGCQKAPSGQTTFQAGEAAAAGPLVYNVVQTTWRTEYGELLRKRMPQNRFLQITLSVTNKGTQSVSLPFFSLEGDNQASYKEVEDGTGVGNWFGVIREIGPGDSRQGNLIFDVPLKSYRLRLTDGGDPTSEKYVWVEIPLNLETDVDSHINLPNLPVLQH
jgi:hypothetical protein